MREESEAIGRQQRKEVEELNKERAEREREGVRRLKEKMEMGVTSAFISVSMKEIEKSGDE